MIALDRTLDPELSRRDQDRWLASRFVADPARRGELVALYTLDGEWRRAMSGAAHPLAGEIRLAWWSEALERYAAGGAADHPALDALGRAAVSAHLARLQAAVEAYAGAELDRAEALVIETAVALLDPGSSVAAPSVQAFPALAHLALRRPPGARPLGEMEKRLRITWAVLRGRL